MCKGGGERISCGSYLSISRYSGILFWRSRDPCPLVLQQLNLSTLDCWSHVCVQFFSVRRLLHLCATLNLRVGLVSWHITRPIGKKFHSLSWFSLPPPFPPRLPLHETLAHCSFPSREQATEGIFIFYKHHCLTVVWNKIVSSWEPIPQNFILQLLTAQTMWVN